MSELVTIKISNYISELSIAKTFLEDQGIICFIKDEYINQIYAMNNSMLGGIKLQVPEENAERARLLLVEGGFAKKEDYEIPKSTMRLVKWYEKLSSIFGKKKD